MKSRQTNSANADASTEVSPEDIRKAYDSLDKEDIIKEVRHMMADMPQEKISAAIRREGSKEKLIKKLLPIAAKKLVMKRLLIAGAAGATVASAAALAEAATSTDLQNLGLAEHLGSSVAENSDSLGDVAADAAKAIFELITEFFR